MGYDVTGEPIPSWAIGTYPDPDPAFCARLGKNCNLVVGTDNCGDTRSVTCGSCTAPQSCGYGTDNVCGPQKWQPVTISRCSALSRRRLRYRFTTIGRYRAWYVWCLSRPCWRPCMGQPTSYISCLRRTDRRTRGMWWRTRWAGLWGVWVHAGCGVEAEGGIGVDPGYPCWSWGSFFRGKRVPFGQRHRQRSGAFAMGRGSSPPSRSTFRDVRAYLAVIPVVGRVFRVRGSASA